MTNTNIASQEAVQFSEAMERSPIAYAYFDPEDRLRYWNQSYVALNFRIHPMIRPGAYFSDLLAELVIRGQIEIPSGGVQAWVDARLEARRKGGTAIRKLTDGRLFLAQERRDAVGGTLGFWMDVTDASAPCWVCFEDAINEPQSLAAHSTDRAQVMALIQTIHRNLELLGIGACDVHTAVLVDEAAKAARTLQHELDGMRPDVH